MLILVATSGDTGSAVAHGFSSLPDGGDSAGRVKVLVLYPENGVSQMQKVQLLSARSRSVDVVGVASDFDFCQSAVKKLLTDDKLSSSLQKKYKTSLSVANSINWVRLLLQVVHHISGYLDLVRNEYIYIGQEIDIAIPTGNFGNIYAALIAKSMGIPIRKLICASNSNNVLSELMNTGKYNLHNRSIIRTISPAIDILKSSNFERFLFEAIGRDGEQLVELYASLEEHGSFTVSPKVCDFMKDTFLADWCSESLCASTILNTYQKTGYLMDTHTAVAKAVANKFRINRGNVPLLICATAHYAKSAEDVLKALGRGDQADASPAQLVESLESLTAVEPAMHKMFSQIMKSTVKKHTVLQPNIGDIVSHINHMLSD